MSLDIDKVRTTVNSIYRKNQVGNYLSTPQFNDIADKVQLDYFRNLLKVLGSTRLNSKDLQDIQVQAFIPCTTVARVGAQATLPTDFWEQGSLTVSFGYTKDGEQLTSRSSATELSQMEFDSVIASEAFPATKEFPVYKMDNGVITLLPDNIQEIGMSYFKYPETPEWAYTTSGNREVYSEGGSTQFTVPQDAFDDIVSMILKELGISTRDEVVIQTSAANEQ